MLDPRRLFPREIPALPEVPSGFDKVVTWSSGPISGSAWQALLSDSIVEIPPNTTQWVELESATLTTGFLDLLCTFDGDNSQAPIIELLCSECYEPPMEQVTSRTKDDRSDFRNGRLYGTTDTYIPPYGTSHYTPFWFRTFRYIRMTITTKNSPLTLESLTYRDTHYPLNVRSTIETTSVFVKKLWTISLNTLQNCMHETYEDCPFYEQNQFAMDTRSQVLFTYLVSRDDRLARKAMQEFYASRREDGLVETHFPNPGRSLNIPTFSLFWVLMVYDHMVHFGDEALVRRYLGAIDDVLYYFDRRINHLGLVGQFDLDCWAFVDWVDGWRTAGKGFKGLAVPKAYYERGTATYHTLIYAYTLLKASEILEFIGRHDTAKEYRNRQQALIQAVNTHCFDPTTGFFLDGPAALGEQSQHVQVFAVLTGCVSGIEAQRLLRRTVLEVEKHGLAKASLAMSFYVFRAVSEAGIYEECWDTLIRPWRTMVANNLTTWAESESMMRSDCHGWSATPLWEIGTEILGVKQRSKEYLRRVLGEEDDAAQVRINPKRGLVEDICADIVVGEDEGDMIHVEWNLRSTEETCSGSQ